jgi:hypothetical protein
MPGSFSSSGSSSFHSDNTSEELAEHETDRSTSPERSVKGKGVDMERDFSTTRQTAGFRSMQDNITTRAEQSQYTQGQQWYPPAINQPYQPRPHPNSMLSEDAPLPSGYDILARTLSSSSHNTPKPLYRTFSTMHHRYLLHLQATICDLEAQLQHMDDVDTYQRTSQSFVYQSSSTSTGRPDIRPAVRDQTSELEYYRSDILNRIGWALERYHTALLQARDLEVEAKLSKARREESDFYKRFMLERRWLGEGELRWLEGKDLVTLERKASPYELAQEAYVGRNGSAGETGFIYLGMAAVGLPLLMFLLIPGFFGRMVVALVIGATSFGLMTQSYGYEIHVRNSRERICIACYIGFMGILASLIS